MNTPTLKELADIGAEAAQKVVGDLGNPGRQAFARAVKDAVEKPLIEYIAELEQKNRNQAEDMRDVAGRLGIFEFEGCNTVKQAATFKSGEIHRLNAALQKAESELAKVIDADHETGWNGIENSKDLAQFINDQADTLEELSESATSQAAKTPTEIPWIEWNGGECPLKDEDVLEWECSWPDGERTKYGCKPSDTTGWDHITRYRVTKWREGQPATVDLTEALAIANKSADEQMRFKREAEARAEKAEARIKDLEEKNKRQADELKDISHRLGVYDNNTTTTKRAATEKCNEIHRLNAVLQKTEAKLADLTLDYINLDAELVAAKALPQLRQLSQAGPVPEGCVRVTGYLSDTGKWAVASFVSSKDTHSADIRLPATAVKAELEVVHDGGEVFLIDPYFALKAAHAAGKVIEVAEKRFGGWNPVKENHNWTFPVEEYRIKPESTFEAHGQTWTKHTPGDPMPCDGEALVFITSDSPDVLRCASLACDWHWGTKTKAKITGWRYADKPKAPVPVPQCDWKEDSDGNWDTSCKQCMCFEHAPPYEQGYKFCHHCGLSINFITFTEEETEP